MHNCASSIRKYTYYRGWKIARGDLADFIELPRILKKDLYNLTLDDIHAIHDGFNQWNYDDRIMHLFNAVTGTRIGETVQLRKRNFHYDYDRIMVKTCNRTDQSDDNDEFCKIVHVIRYCL